MMEYLQIRGYLTHEIKASDAGNEIQFQVVVTDNLGNIENGILYELQIAETSTDDTQYIYNTHYFNSRNFISK